MVLVLTGGGSLLSPQLLRRNKSEATQRPKFFKTTQLISVFAGLLTFTGAMVPFLAFFASLLSLLATFLQTRIFKGAEFTSQRIAFICLSLICLIIAVAQPLGLKVLLLPHADELEKISARVEIIKTYDEGQSLEGIASGIDGTLYITANRNIDFSNPKYYQNAEGELIARSPDGTEKILFKTPKGQTAGVISFAKNGVLYMSSHGDESTIWQISTNGNSKPVAKLPEGAWPNGIDIGPDNKIYSADSNLGIIWQIDPQNGKINKVVENEALKARPYIALAPGANGLEFLGNHLYVTVSDKTTVLKFELDGTGKLGEATELAKGIPGDDFAIRKDGALFITTHPYNTLVRVLPNGERKLIADEKDQMIGATDAEFVSNALDQAVLYIVTDGGAFTAGSKAKGQLLAVYPD